MRFRSYLGSSPIQRALFRKTGQSLTGGTAFEADATALKRPFSSIEAHVAVARHWTKLSVLQTNRDAQWRPLRFKHSRKLNGVSAEMSLNVLAYNLKRVMKIMGTEGLLKAMTA